MQLLFLTFTLFININSSLYTLRAISPLPSLYNPKCHQSEYQFIIPEIKQEYFLKGISQEKGTEFFGKIAKEAINVTSQTVYLLNPTENFPNHQRTFYFKLDPKIQSKKALEKKYKLDKVILKDPKYFITVSKSETLSSKKVIMKSNSVIIANTTINNNIAFDWIFKKELQTHLYSLMPYQKTSYFPFKHDFHNKLTLYLKYLALHNKFPNDYDYMPASYEIPFTKNSTKKKFKDYKLSLDDLYIMKPASGCCGNKVEIYTGKNKLPKDGIISRYLSNPLLIHGRKFDIRLYMFITGFHPLKVYLHREGLVRLSGQKYELSENSLNNSMIHLTNLAVAFKNIKGAKSKKVNADDGYEWTLDNLKKYLQKRSINFEPIWKKIKDLSVKTAISFVSSSVKPENNKYLLNNNNIFQLVAMDIFIDSNLKPWLIETSYGLGGTSSKTDNDSKARVMADIMNIVGVVPYDHSDVLQTLDPKPTFENQIEQDIYETFCEFERPIGNMERIFPRLDNIKKYSKFFDGKASIENRKLWELMEKLKYN